MDPALFLIAIAWLAIAAMLLWGVATSLCGLFLDDAPLPLFAMLEYRGLSVAQLEHAVGLEAFARAVRRCAQCPQKAQCRPGRVDCPNEPLLRRMQKSSCT